MLQELQNIYIYNGRHMFEEAKVMGELEQVCFPFHPIYVKRSKYR